MTNPASAIKVLITYAVCIPLAILVGYTLTDPLDYGTLGIFGLIALLLLSPVFIKWHYPIMLFGLAAPIYCFFLKGNPPLGQVVVLLSFGIAIIERAMNSERRFLSAPVVVWAYVFTGAMAVMTAELTGGIGLKALGGGVDGGVGGGKKYIALFIGVATFFAFISRGIPKNRRNLYLALFFLPGVLQIFSDLFPYLPNPLNYINLLIPPSYNPDAGVGFSNNLTRFGSFGSAATAAATYMLAKYGLGGVFRVDRPLRFILFIALFVLTLLGGFRIVLIYFLLVGTLLFFLEGLYRTKMLPVMLMLIVMCMSLLIPFAEKLPFSFQRALTVVPFLKLDSAAVLDAAGSKQWREDIWHDTWPKVPHYLLLGKGYALTAEDYELIGAGQFANGTEANLDKSNVGLAVSGDYHSGPLSTLMPFGIWGAISYLWIALAGLFVTYRNYKYGDPDLKTINIFFFVLMLQGIFGFFVLFGAYSDDVGSYAKVIGFSIALNWGVRKPAPRPAAVAQSQIKRLPSRPQPLPA